MSSGALSRIGKLARGKRLVDPFTGGGTILVEAVKLGFEAYGIDANPGAVEVARATLHTACGKCLEAVKCLEESLGAASRVTGILWRTPSGGMVIHAFLTRCPREPCRAPALLASRPGKWAIVLDPSSPTWIREVSDTQAYSPLHPQVQLPSGLPEAAPGYRVYAVELEEPGGRRLIALPGSSGREAWIWAVETLAQAKVLAPQGCTRVPLLREARKLAAAGIRCWEHLFTPRQLASLRAFVEEADARGCGWWARLVVANATRTCSLLAFYYQPYRRVNPGLVVKSYWLPPYPVELNPLAGSGPRTLARGTLYSYVGLFREACSRSWKCPGKYVVRRGDARNPESYPGDINFIVTDPPYPGMMSYTDMSLPYLYWLGHPFPSKPYNPMRGRGLVELIEGFTRAAASRSRPEARMALIMSSSPGEEHTLAQSLAAPTRSGWGLTRLYWLPGEAPGRMGRSRRRGVYVALYRLGRGDGDALEPLGWVRETALGVEGVDRDAEARAASRLASLLSGLLG